MTTKADGPADMAWRIASLVGTPVESLRAVTGRGFMAEHLLATLADGGTVFVKYASTDYTRSVLKGEALAYAAIGNQPFLPAVIANDDDLLIIQDLTHAYWPPPWRPRDIPRVREALIELAGTRAPDGLRDLDRGPWPGSWASIADDSASLVRLGVCSNSWLEGAADLLIAADDCPLGGDSLVHGDLRSDNLCLTDGKVMFVDWAAAARGRPDYDLTTFAIAAAAETATLPDDLNPTADPALVATITSVLACHAPNEHVPQPIRHQLEAHLRVALPWCARLLNLPPP